MANANLAEPKVLNLSSRVVEWESVNPMITADGDTYRVSSVLVALADLLTEEKSMKPDGCRDFGLSVILQTAAAALRYMGEIKQ